MSASALMSVAMKGMAANYAGMQTTGHNITNASVEGYSRQTVKLATAQGQYTGAGFFGKGVDVATVSRNYDSFLAREADSTASRSSYDSSRSSQLSALEAVFAGGDSGLGAQLSSYLNAYVDVASTPQDLSARQVVLADAGALANRFAAAASQIDTIQQGVTQALQSSVSQINELTQQLASVNDSIAKLMGAGHDPNDLLDQRGQLVSKLSQLLPITTIANPTDNTVSVFVAGGQQLVLGSQAQTVQLGADEFDSSRSVLQITGTDGAHTIDSASLSSGSVGGLLRFQNDDLVRARSLVGQLANSLATAVNAQQAQGQDLTGTTGTDLFQTGQAGVVLPASGNTPPSTVSITVDATAAQASEYELYADAGGWKLRSRPDGTVSALTVDGAGDANPVDGITVHLGSPAPATTQRYLLQPVARVANGMSTLLTDPRRVAAAQGSAENANALAMVNLRDQLTVGKLQDPTTGSLSGGNTFTDSWASAMADIGVRVQGAQSSAQISGAMASSAKQSATAISGVNLDEEAANLMQYQQGYQACAKVLQVAQQVFQELLNVAGG